MTITRTAATTRFDQRRARAAAMREAGAEFDEIGAALGVGQAQAKRLVLEQRKRDRASERGDLGTQLSFRAMRAINVHLGLGMWERPDAELVIAALTAMTYKQFNDTPQVGSFTADEVRAWLEARGRAFLPATPRLRRGRACG